MAQPSPPPQSFAGAQKFGLVGPEDTVTEIQDCGTVATKKCLCLKLSRRSAAAF